MSGLCGGCGHDFYFHGRAGHGGCRVNRGGPLAAACYAVERGVVRGDDADMIGAAVSRAMTTAPCQCKRFRKKLASETSARSAPKSPPDPPPETA